MGCFTVCHPRLPEFLFKYSLYFPLHLSTHREQNSKVLLFSCIVGSLSRKTSKEVTAEEILLMAKLHFPGLLEKIIGFKNKVPACFPSPEIRGTQLS